MAFLKLYVHGTLVQFGLNLACPVKVQPVRVLNTPDHKMFYRSVESEA